MSMIYYPMSIRDAAQHVRDLHERIEKFGIRQLEDDDWQIILAALDDHVAVLQDMADMQDEQRTMELVPIPKKRVN